ncbi:MAG: hypothetical protein CVU64_12535 [Deltaproteobacteria bacterium HGW-Deltaproteobacteria-21]|nr:MAG: hypothetical protein CVU64_12535 [Deltaproteobacteria bacterium HGW-Deltaproteobacteria-21]
MVKKYTSTILLISLIALGSSGLMMMFLDSFAFQLRMHPVHNIFGIIMCISGCLYICLNFQPLKNYLKERQILIAGISLAVVLMFLYAIGLHRPIDPAFVDKIEGVMLELRHRR